MISGGYRTLLRGYRHLPKRLRRRLVRWIAPSFTAGAMCVIEREDGAVLLVRHAYRPFWGCPGGLLQRGEEPGAAARREVKEEVGLDVEILTEPLILLDWRARRIDVVFQGRVQPPVPDVVEPASGEIVEVRWFARHLLPVLQAEAAEALARMSEQAKRED